MSIPASASPITDRPTRQAGSSGVQALAQPSPWMATWTLWQREVVRFLRQRSRIVGALATPIVFWVLIGSGLGRSFQPPGSSISINYLEYFFPGTLVMILLFTAIFSTISVIEDRREGFLQSVMVSPAPRWSIALGKILGGTTLAWGQGLLFCALAPLCGIELTVWRCVELFFVVFILAFGQTGLGLLVAWPMESTQGYHAIMNIFLIPMWLLSGALFPASGAPAFLRWIMMINPVTYAVSAVRGIFYPDVTAVAGTGAPGMLVSLVVSTLFGLVMFAACVWLAVRNKRAST